jgi:hypothetical protein
MLLNQYGNGAFLAASFVGGEYYHRDHREDPNARDPMVPVEFAKQREALRFLQEKILSDQAFRFDPALLRKLGADRWYHWGNEFAVESGVDYPLHARILNIQRVALYQLTSAQVLARLQDSATKVDPQTNPLRMAEVFRALSDGVWGDLPTKDGKGKTPSDIRRNLQREYLQVLSNLALGRGGRSMPPDARSLARLHLKEIRQKLADALASPQIAKDDTVRAHLDECHDRVTKVLNASIQAES